MKIEFEPDKYQYDKIIKKSIEICEQCSGYLQIDENFCVYAFYDNKEHWVGYAQPHDMGWFQERFHIIPKEDFERQYREKSNISMIDYRRHFVTLPCNCGEQSCCGWACVSNNERSMRTHNALYNY